MLTETVGRRYIGLEHVAIASFRANPAVLGQEPVYFPSLDQSHP